MGSQVCVAIALGASLAAQHYGFRDVALPVFALSIAVTSWHAGIGPSVLSVFLCTALFTYFFVEPIYSFEVSRRELPYLFVFVAGQLLQVLCSGPAPNRGGPRPPAG